MPRRKMDSYERVEVASRATWRAWLERNHERAEGIWLVTFKKHVADRYIGYDAVVEEAICFGWIDSLPRRLDEDRSMLLLTPRQPGSPWSRLNKTRVAKLEKAGLLDPVGQAKIDAAKADGSWSVLDDVEDLVVPPDLEQALATDGEAERGWAGYAPSLKKGILWWVKSAKRAETRARRVEKTVASARVRRPPL